MGLFNKIKAMKNAVTGGAATITLDTEGFSLTETFKITIKAQTKDASVKVDKVYLRIHGFEEIEVPDVDVIYDEDDNTHRRIETVYASHTTVELEITAANAQELEPNQSYEWEVEVKLPEHAPAIYHGQYCQHVYRAFAGLDCFGNDPDSGWVELHG